MDVWCEVLNSATGHFDDAAILSVYCPRDGVSSINFELADASDVVSSFVHRMKLSKGKGMLPVERLDLGDLAGDTQ